MDKTRNAAIAAALAIGVLIFYFSFLTTDTRQLRRLERALTTAERNAQAAENGFIDFLLDNDVDALYGADPEKKPEYVQLVQEQLTELEEHIIEIEDIACGRAVLLNLITRLTTVRAEGLDITPVSYSGDMITRHQVMGRNYNRFSMPVRINCYFSQLVSYLKYCVDQPIPIMIDGLKIRAVGEKVQAVFNASWIVVEGAGRHHISSVADELRAHEVNISRDIFYRKVERPVEIIPPVLRAEGLQTPEDPTGTFALYWETNPDIVRYDLYMNDEVFERDASSPIQFRGLDDGSYEFVLNGIYPGMIERVSNPVHAVIRIPPPELPELKGIVSFGNHIMALIDDNILKKDDKYRDFIILSIESESVHIEAKQTGHTFELKLEGPWSRVKREEVRAQ